MRAMYVLFPIFVLAMIGYIGYIFYDAQPAQNKISHVAVISNENFNMIEIKHDGETQKLNSEVISRIEPSDKDYSYYSYWQGRYTLHLLPDDYAKINGNDD